MLVSAFSGLDTMKQAYAHAISDGLPVLFLWRCLPAVSRTALRNEAALRTRDRGILKETRRTRRVKFQEEALRERAPKHLTAIRLLPPRS